MECQEYLIFLFCGESLKSVCVLLLWYILVWTSHFSGAQKGRVATVPGSADPASTGHPHLVPAPRPTLHISAASWSPGVCRLGLAWGAGQAGPDLEECLRPSQESRECQARHLDVIVLSFANGLPAPSPRPDQVPSLPSGVGEELSLGEARGRRGLPR